MLTCFDQHAGRGLSTLPLIYNGPGRDRQENGDMRQFDAVQGIIVATLLGALIWTLIVAGLN